ncbi:hypothetical protein [Lutispora thermophila]|uniref:Uncharacterized protein n=1 Tax=Lutispora thermophila DSM 19022 TaxID=1122184 RepID=A0A1M6I8P1_9FIRM|nr:hypothetical protein [Lutispora thermophila]SHJ30792.1 hypothetical protein SAMN02745176_03131 [Lutispora thermophila DSM 19022]
MSSSMKLITFIFSLFVFLIASVIFNTIFAFFPAAQSETGLIPVIAGYLNIMFSTMLMILSQGFFRTFYIRRVMNKLGTYNIIGEYPVTPFRLVDRIIIYIFPSLPVILPFFKGETLNQYTLWGIALLVLFIIITELLFKFFNKTMKIIVIDKGIQITGFDMRLELPISANYPNGFGFYPFERIEGFRYMKKKLVLYHTYDLGPITIDASEDDIKRIKGLLLQNNILESRIDK